MKVSVVCTCYNKAPFISTALQSIVTQQGSFEWELIVIDDASTDNSPDIIHKYEELYSEHIMAVHHDYNQGIAQTWLEGCSLATGDYIARCDGDDYWFDNKKIEKQLIALKQNNNSKWCSTDFDVVNPKGELIQSFAVANNYVRSIHSFEEMLAYKGMTMSSTWLIEHSLLREVNKGLDKTAVDDTFNIQLELFKRTKLLFLEDSTTAYRIGEQSDSHPIEIDKIRERILRLKQTQLEYAAYSDIDYKVLIDCLIDFSTDFEIAYFEEREKARIECEQLKSELADCAHQLNMIVNSRRWKLISQAAKVFGR